MIAFLANSFHISQTKSADFFIDFLRNQFGEVVIIPHKEAWDRLPRSHWDMLISWQKLYAPEELEAFGADRVVLAPMYDDCPKDFSFWKRYLKFKIFCFSSTLERTLASFGLSAWGCRYYPEVPERRAHFAPTGLRGFFWPRSASINLELVKKLIDGAHFADMHVHWTPDVHSDLPKPFMDPDNAVRNFSVSTWFTDRKQYLEYVSNANVFFAPRLYEGIGMSFLEAMSMGHCVVAARFPTMNEYIQDGETGLLFDPAAPTPLDFSHAQELGEAAHSSCVRGREAWRQSLPAIRSFLETPAPGYRARLHPAIVLRGRSFALARKIYRLLKRLLGR